MVTQAAVVMSFCLQQVNAGCGLLRGAYWGERECLRGSKNVDENFGNFRILIVYTALRSVMKTTTETETACVVDNVFVVVFISLSKAVYTYNFPKFPSLLTPALSARGHYLSPRKLPTLTQILYSLDACKMTS